MPRNCRSCLKFLGGGQVRNAILQWSGTFAGDCVTEKDYLGDAKDSFCWIDEEPVGLELLEVFVDAVHAVQATERRRGCRPSRLNSSRGL
jgi:spore cortex formation protein SpoVR/YcgB (stage V sporulation)